MIEQTINDPEGNWKIHGTTLKINRNGGFMGHRDFVFENAASVDGFRRVLQDFRSQAHHRREKVDGYYRLRANYVRQARDAWREANAQTGNEDRNHVRRFIPADCAQRQDVPAATKNWPGVSSQDPRGSVQALGHTR